MCEELGCEVLFVTLLCALGLGGGDVMLLPKDLEGFEDMVENAP